MKKSTNIDDYVDANTLVLPEYEGSDIIVAELYSIMEELHKLDTTRKTGIK
jgi:hypothetical protein